MLLFKGGVLIYAEHCILQASYQSLLAWFSDFVWVLDLREVRLIQRPLLSSFLMLFSALLVYKGLNCCESVYSPSMAEASISGAYIVAGIWVTDLCVTVHFYLKIHLVESVSDWLLRLNVFEANRTLHYDGRGCFWKEPNGCWDGSVVCIFLGGWEWRKSDRCFCFCPSYSWHHLYCGVQPLRGAASHRG